MEMRAVSLPVCDLDHDARPNSAILAIQAPIEIPPPHSHDRALLRPLSTLGKPKFADAQISFLRRTEYISSHTSKSRFESTTSKSLTSGTGNRIRKPASTLDKEAPSAIKKAIEDSFKVAQNSLRNKSSIQHPNPSKRNLRVVEAYPLLPDDNAWTDAGGYCEVKFFTNPVPPSTVYDDRLEVALLKPLEPTEAEEARRQALQEAYERDPRRHPAPETILNYDFFLPLNTPDVKNIKRKFDTLDADHDSADLYTHTNEDGVRCFRYKKIRAYESIQPAGSQEGKYDTVVLALHDGKDGEHQKAAHYYPLVQKIVIKPQRNKHIEMKRLRLSENEQENDGVDFIELEVVQPSEQVESMRRDFREFPYGRPQEEDEPEVVVVEEIAKAGYEEQEKSGKGDSDGGEEDAEGDDE